MRTPIQHGELMLVPVDDLPKGKTRQVQTQVVAHSESGHHHVVEATQAFEVLGDVDTADLYLRLYEPAKLVHQKTSDAHRTLDVPAGTWKVLKKTEYDPFSAVIRTVKD